jgi:hypothetical protein
MMNKHASKLQTYLDLYRRNPDSLAVLMMQNPHVLKGAWSAFTGAEGEGGYFMRQDLPTTVSGQAVTLDGQPLGEIWADLQERLAAFNTQMSFMVSLFSFPVERAQERVGIYQTPRFEDATELGRPQKIRLAWVTRGFPLKHKDLGFGYTQEYLDSARGEQIRAVAAQAENAWWSLNMETVLEAIFNNVNLTDDDGVSIKRLYNNDGEVPPPYKRWSHLGTHTHYLTSGGASFDGTDLNAIEEHLLHHGYGDFGERFILHMNRTELVTARGLTDFVPAVSSSIPIVVDGQVVGTQRAGIPGLAPEGYHGKLVIVENNDIPAGYLLAHATGGTFATENVAGLRQHENPGIRGMRLIEGPVARYPLIDAVYDGYLGAGVRHRGGAVVMQVTAGGYTVPTL